jgi:hypothetical protein
MFIIVDYRLHSFTDICSVSLDKTNFPLVYNVIVSVHGNTFSPVKHQAHRFCRKWLKPEINSYKLAPSTFEESPVLQDIWLAAE